MSLNAPESDLAGAWVVGQEEEEERTRAERYYQVGTVACLGHSNPHISYFESCSLRKLIISGSHQRREILSGEDLYIILGFFFV